MSTRQLYLFVPHPRVVHPLFGQPTLQSAILHQDVAAARMQPPVDGSAEKTIFRTEIWSVVIR